MLTKCPECELPVSTNALSCPHCGNPLKRISKNPHREKSRMRLPNGFGQISFLKGRNLRNPYRAMITVGKNSTGRPICKVFGYYSSYNDAYAALVEYNKNPYDLDRSITVQELYEKWSEKYFENITPSSKRTITAAWAYCGSVYSMKAQDIRARHIKGCMDTADSPNIKSRIKSMFNLMLDYAVEYEIVDKNYARDFKVERVETKDGHHAFTDDEMKILWENISIPIVNMIVLNCYTGWRPQELCKMKHSDVNIIEMTMTGGMKTEAGKNRTVPICSKVQSLAKKLETLSNSLNSEWFCCDLDGSELTYDKYHKRFNKIMKELGIEGHKPHDARKTFITKCKEYNVDEYAIKRMAGHSIDDITEALYTERKLDWLKSEVEKITE